MTDDGIVRLNLGCGRHDIKAGWINCDYVQHPGVDMVFDLTKQLPFDDGTVDHIYLSHVLEHIFTWPDTLLECHRILKPGGTVFIRVPYGCSKHNPDGLHVRFFWEETLNAFLTTDSPGLDAAPLNGTFEVIDRSVYKMLWGHWHIRKYLRIKFFDEFLYRCKLLPGYKKEIRWYLRKRRGCFGAYRFGYDMYCENCPENTDCTLKTLDDKRQRSLEG